MAYSVTAEVNRKELYILKVLRDSTEPLGARVTGIPYLIDAYREEAMSILNS